MKRLQDIEELEKWHQRKDPWGYESNPDDTLRKEILLSAIPDKTYQQVLDIGCGQGFVTVDLPGNFILGVDISKNAISFAKKKENDRIKFATSSIYSMSKSEKRFDLVILSGVCYPQYVAQSKTLIYLIVDKILNQNGILISFHIKDWYDLNFPYFKLKNTIHHFSDYDRLLEVYCK